MFTVYCFMFIERISSTRRRKSFCQQQAFYLTRRILKKHDCHENTRLTWTNNDTEKSIRNML